MAERMTLRERSIKDSYDTMDPNGPSPLDDFYIPVLSSAARYYRMSGFFSSTSIAIAAKGIAALIANRGKMHLICGPSLSAEDIAIFTAAINGDINAQQRYFEEAFAPSSDEIREDYLNAMGWMLANGYLEIKIALVQDENGNGEWEKTNSIFHMKVGIVEDWLGNTISFSGSNNETAAGWLENVEEFKVFKSWEEGDEKHIETDKSRFDRAWNNIGGRMRVLDLPEAMAEGLKRRAVDFDKDKFVLKHYRERLRESNLKRALNLRRYQLAAVEFWRQHDYRALFEMATGTGKTRTAIACISEIQKMEPKLLVIVSSPQIHLSEQWEENCRGKILNEYEPVICDSTNHRWKNDLELAIAKMKSDFSLYGTTIAFVTHDTVSSDTFLNIVKGATCPVLFIGDEVHGLGARGRRKAFRPEFRYRIGLSATPARWFDEVGSTLISEYFGNESYRLTIADALRLRCVCEYTYHPVFIDMTTEEMDEYEKLSEQIRKIARSIDETDDELEARLNRLLEKRADVIKDAALKMSALEKLIPNLPERQNILAFCSPRQIEDVVNLFNGEGILAAEYTYRQSAIKRRNEAESERKRLLTAFERQQLQALVAIKCLDEGVDIPSATTGILISSSTNPREYIQRIGRVIRTSPYKNRAHIYDFIVRPGRYWPDGANVYLKELRRAKYIAENSLNPATALITLNEEMRRYEH